MGKKAVYNNKMLAIYISGEDFERLLTNKTIDVPVFIGKAKTVRDWTVVKLIGGLNSSIERAFALEQAAIDKARNEHLSGFGQHARIIQNRNRS